MLIDGRSAAHCILQLARLSKKYVGTYAHLPLLIISVVAAALTQNGIKYVSLDQDSKTRNVAELFKKDKSISVFLLHAEKERYAS